MMKNLSTLLLLTALFTSCKKDDEKPSGPSANEEELITTVNLRFENINNSNDTIIATFKDTDGEGGNDPIQFDTISLLNSNSYLLDITVLNESDPIETEDITSEILTEGDEHQFFFSGTAISMGHVDVMYRDQDTNGKPIGLQDTVVANSLATNMVFRVTLRHEPDKNATNVSDGDITNAGGETDIELDYILSVQ